MYPANDPKYANIPAAAKVRTESLAVRTFCKGQNPCPGVYADVFDCPTLMVCWLFVLIIRAESLVSGGKDSVGTKWDMS
jgi:hypothetical protein